VAIALDAAFAQLRFLEVLERKRLHGRARDPGDAGSHPSNDRGLM
jgi:hypothetical protein